MKQQINSICEKEGHEFTRCSPMPGGGQGCASGIQCFRCGYVDRAIVSKDGKYCSNPETHIHGSKPCCEGIWINMDLVDPNDILLKS